MDFFDSGAGLRGGIGEEVNPGVEDFCVCLNVRECVSSDGGVGMEGWDGLFKGLASSVSRSIGRYGLLFPAEKGEVR